MAHTLEIKDLYTKTKDTGMDILKGFNLTMHTGEVHAIMGPNGNGKSTLVNTIMGNPKYVVTQGDILFDGESILNKSVDERARLGLFLAYQNPAEVPGVTNSDFVRAAMKATTGKDVSLFKFIKEYDKACTDLKMPEGLSHRFLNEGFSGGEKKRNEVLQLKMLKPAFSLLDEIDSGLDVDALRIVGDNVYNLVGENMGVLLITHYKRLLEYIKPTHVHVLINGKIVKNGGNELIDKIDSLGYDWVKKELGIEIEKKEEQKSHVMLEACARAPQKK